MADLSHSFNKDRQVLSVARLNREMGPEKAAVRLLEDTLSWFLEFKERWPKIDFSLEVTNRCWTAQGQPMSAYTAKDAADHFVLQQILALSSSMILDPNIHQGIIFSPDVSNSGRHYVQIYLNGDKEIKAYVLEFVGTESQFLELRQALAKLYGCQDANPDSFERLTIARGKELTLDELVSIAKGIHANTNPSPGVLDYLNRLDNLNRIPDLNSMMDSLYPIVLHHLRRGDIESAISVVMEAFDVPFRDSALILDTSNSSGLSSVYKALFPNHTTTSSQQGGTGFSTRKTSRPTTVGNKLIFPEAASLPPRQTHREVPERASSSSNGYAYPNYDRSFIVSEIEIGGKINSKTKDPDKDDFSPSGVDPAPSRETPRVVAEKYGSPSILSGPQSQSRFVKAIGFMQRHIAKGVESSTSKLSRAPLETTLTQSITSKSKKLLSVTESSFATSKQTRLGKRDQANRTSLVSRGTTIAKLKESPLNMAKQPSAFRTASKIDQVKTSTKVARQKQITQGHQEIRTKTSQHAKVSAKPQPVLVTESVKREMLLASTRSTSQRPNVTSQPSRKRSMARPLTRKERLLKSLKLKMLQSLARSLASQDSELFQLFMLSTRKKAKRSSLEWDLETLILLLIDLLQMEEEQRLRILEALQIEEPEHRHQLDLALESGRY